MLGPGKVDLLKAVGVAGSISSAARSLGMSYKRAWLLIDTLNQGFGRRVLVATHGGKGGGGTELTPLGKKLIERYESIERACTIATKVDVQAITHLLNAKK